MATRREVEAKLHELIRRLDRAEEGAAALSEALPERKVVEVRVPDLGESYWAELDGGRMGGLHRGPPQRADMQIEASSDELIEVIDGRLSLFSSYVAGRVKIRAGLSDLIRLRRLA